MAEQRPPLDFWEITNLRRVELGKRWKDVLAETGLSHETLNRWRKGLKVDPLTDQAFERALVWSPGARAACAAGREPALLHTPTPMAKIEAALEAAAPSMSPRELEMLAGILAMLAEGREMSDADMAATLRRAQEIIQERRRERVHRVDQPNASPQDRAV